MRRLTEEQAKELLPERMLERIKTRCLRCPDWKGNCHSAGIICYVEWYTPEGRAIPERKYHYTIWFWLTIQRIKDKVGNRKHDRKPLPTNREGTRKTSSIV